MKIIDKDLALERAGGNLDLARELHQMLLRDLPGNREQIRQLFNEQEYEGLLEKVHKLHGATAYCGVPALKEAAFAFETHLKQGESDQYAPALELLMQEIDRLEAAETF